MMRWNITGIVTETLALAMKLWQVHSQCNLFLFQKVMGLFADQVIEIQDTEKTCTTSARVAVMSPMQQQNCKTKLH